MLVNEDLTRLSEEGKNHIIDWRSFRAPRIARSSLGKSVVRWSNQ